MELPYLSVVGYYGAIDASGNVVIKPDYLALEPAKDGKLVGIHSKYKETEDRAKVKNNSVGYVW